MTSIHSQTRATITVNRSKIIQRVALCVRIVIKRQKINIFVNSRGFQRKMHTLLILKLIHHKIEFQQIWIKFFFPNKTKDHAIKPPKPINFQIIKTKVIKNYTAHLCMLIYHTIKFKYFDWKVFYLYFFPLKNKGVQSKSRGTLNSNL